MLVMRRRQKTAGFTILELMMAATVFAVILLVVAMGVINFTNQYYRGINATKTHAVARAIINEVTESIQFGKNVTTGLTDGGNTQGVCIDNTMYSYVIGQEVTDSLPFGMHQNYHGLIVDTGGCSTPSVPNSSALPNPSTQRELLSQHMRLGAFTVTSLSSGMYTVHVRVIYGDDDLLTSTNWGTALCNGSVTGSQFCAVADLTTTVQQRL